MTDLPSEYSTVVKVTLDLNNMWHYCRGSWIPGSTGMCSDGFERYDHMVHLTSTTPPRKGPIRNGQAGTPRESA